MPRDIWSPTNKPVFNPERVKKSGRTYLTADVVTPVPPITLATHGWHQGAFGSTVSGGGAVTYPFAAGAGNTIYLDTDGYLDQDTRDRYDMICPSDLYGYYLVTTVLRLQTFPGGGTPDFDALQLFQSCGWLPGGGFGGPAQIAPRPVTGLYGPDTVTLAYTATYPILGETIGAGGVFTDRIVTAIGNTGSVVYSVRTINDGADFGPYVSYQTGFLIHAAA